MNERIQQLADKAIEDMPGAWNIPDEFCKKFTELFVQECISTLEEKIYRSIDNEGDETWIDLILKEHFGVEEWKQ
jgi:hypothetical protein